MVSVTGATGFVGRHVVRTLLERGHAVRCLVRDPAKAAETLPEHEGLALVVGDVFDASARRELLAGCEAVVHTIGIRRETGGGVTFERVHVEATRLVAESAREAGVRRFVHISALGVRADATTAYGRSKFRAERVIRGSGLDWTILRPSLVHGPDGEFVGMVRDWVLGRAAPFAVIPYFARVDMSDPTGPKLESASVEPVSVQDVADAVASALATPGSIGEVYPLPGPDSFTWPEMLRILRDAMPMGDTGKPIVPLPGLAAHAAALGAGAVGLGATLPFGPSEPIMAIEDNAGSLAKAVDQLGLSPRPFERTVADYAPQI